MVIIMDLRTTVPAISILISLSATGEVWGDKTNSQRHTYTSLTYYDDKIKIIIKLIVVSLFFFKFYLTIQKYIQNVLRSCYFYSRRYVSPLSSIYPL